MFVIVGNMNVEILVSEAPSPHRRVRFFQSGRQINFVGDVKSFMDVSVAKVYTRSLFMVPRLTSAYLL